MWDLKNQITERTSFFDETGCNSPLQRLQIEEGVKNWSHFYKQATKMSTFIYNTSLKSHTRVKCAKINLSTHILKGVWLPQSKTIS